MEFTFIKPTPPGRNQRRVITRHLVNQLVTRVAERAGLPRDKVGLLKEGERVRVRVQDGRRLDFKPAEEVAILDAEQWEKTGEGEGPRLPL